MRVSIRVVERVAERKGVDPTDLPPLHQFVNPDALDTMFDGGTSGSLGEGDVLEFSYAGERIRVEGDGVVSVFSSESNSR